MCNPYEQLIAVLDCLSLSGFDSRVHDRSNSLEYVSDAAKYYSRGGCNKREASRGDSRRPSGKGAVHESNIFCPAPAGNRLKRIPVDRTHTNDRRHRSGTFQNSALSGYYFSDLIIIKNEDKYYVGASGDFLRTFKRYPACSGKPFACYRA
jgi:hypothetical protein